MTWKSHTAVTAAITYAVTLDPIFAAAASVGAVLPDRIEFILPWLKHRGNSHALALWIVLITILALANGLSGQIGAGAQEVYQMTYYLFAVAIGGLLHILEDMCSVSGIPLLPTFLTPTQKPPTLKVPLYKTGHLSEYIVAGVILLVSAGVIALRTNQMS
jgi:membrane-bound metal-dependent hydrolase YbcI (DUF457 family)